MRRQRNSTVVVPSNHCQRAVSKPFALGDPLVDMNFAKILTAEKSQVRSLLASEKYTLEEQLLLAGVNGDTNVFFIRQVFWFFFRCHATYLTPISQALALLRQRQHEPCNEEDSLAENDESVCSDDSAICFDASVCCHFYYAYSVL